MSNPYAYENRDGVRPISWEDIFGLCKGLALAAASFNPEVIVGIARGGLYPATLLSHMMQVELFAVRLSRRVNDKIVHRDPVWIQRPTEYLKAKRVLVVDEISDTGQTLAIVKQELERIGVSAVRTAVLYAHKQSARSVNYAGIVTDELVLNPWDREILTQDGFKLHPEYREALSLQNSEDPEKKYLLGIEAVGPEYTDQ